MRFVGFFLYLLLLLYPSLSYCADPKADKIRTDTTNFNNRLSSSDTDVQRALDTLDNSSGGGASTLSDLTDVNSSTATAGRILVADGTDWESVAVSGDCTMASTGVERCIGSSSSGNVLLNTSGAIDGSANLTWTPVFNYLTLNGTMLFGNSVDQPAIASLAVGRLDIGDILGTNSLYFDFVSTANTVTIGSALSTLYMDYNTLQPIFNSDYQMGDNTSGKLPVGNGTKYTPKAVSGDATLAGTGALTIADNAVQISELGGVNSTTATSGNLLIADGTDWESIGLTGDVTITSTGVTTVVADTIALSDLSDVNSSTATAGNILIADGTDWESVTLRNAVANVQASRPIQIDTTDDQLQFLGSSSIRVLPYEITRCHIIENVTSADDNIPLEMFADAVTITSVGCSYVGTGTTVATFTLEDGSGNAMTITGTNPTCQPHGTNAVFASVSAGGGLNAGEIVRFDTTNTPSPTTDDYSVCITYTVDAQ